jgi:hypothetical protein|tara:strand:+ start:12678 stop:13094 length:417 start_codon:yes stop_codon:yes gene_type:complete
MHFAFLFLISLFSILFVSEKHTSFAIHVSLLSIAVISFTLGIVSMCVLDCKYSYEGAKTIVRNPYGDSEHKCWIETTEGKHFLESSWESENEVHIYKLESEKIAGFIVCGSNKEHSVGFILRNGKDKHLDSFIEKKEN